MRSSIDENRSNAGNPIGNYLFMRPLLRHLGRGDFVYSVVSIALRVCAALIILGSLAFFFNAGKVTFGLPTTGAIMGGILFQLFYIVAIYAVVHVFLIRAKDIDRREPGEVFMLPLGALLVRLAGEAYASFVSFIAIGGGFFVWFTSKKIVTILGPLSKIFPVMRDADFITGIEFMFSGVLIAIGALIVSYMVAELIMLLVKANSANTAVSSNGDSGSAANGNGNGGSSGPRQLPNRTSIKSRFGS